MQTSSESVREAKSGEQVDRPRQGVSEKPPYLDSPLSRLISCLKAPLRRMMRGERRAEEWIQECV